MDANGHEERQTNRSPEISGVKLKLMDADGLVVGLAIERNTRRIEQSRQNRNDPQITQITQISLGGVLALRGK